MAVSDAEAVPGREGDGLVGDVLLAVGIPKGLVVPSEGETEGDPTQWIRAGGMSCPLPPPIFEMWATAMIPQKADYVASAGKAAGVETPTETIKWLEKVGLLLRVGGPTADTFGDVRVLPLALGLGNDPARGIYRVADLGLKTVLELEPLSYGLWDQFDGATPISVACAAVSEATSLDESIVFAQVPRLLVQLMAARYIFIDRPVDRAAILA